MEIYTMNIITDIKEIEGKEVLKASMIDCDETLSIIFSDDSCIFADVSRWGDTYEITLADDVSNYSKVEAGVMTQDELNAINKARDKKINDQIETKERATLTMLKAKYE